MKRIKLAVLAAVIVMTCFVFSACSAPRMERPAMSGEAVAVSATCSAVYDGQNVVVTATTDMLKGTNVRLSLTGADGKQIAKQSFELDGSGTLTASFPVEADWGDKVYAFFVATPSEDGRQLSDITAVYGERFENLQGENVIWTNEFVCLSVQSEPVMLTAAPAEPDASAAPAQ